MFSPTVFSTLRSVQSSKPGSVRLFCIPYAGGSASVYSDWITSVPDWLQICPVELPGRGWLWMKPLATSLVELARIISSAIYPYAHGQYAIFGHSMGALLAYEVALNLKALGRHDLCRLFISGSRAPFRANKRSSISQLSDDEFLDHIRSMRGTPEEILTNPELMKLFVPLLRADFQMCEEYRVDRVQPLRCAVTVLGGEADEEVSEGDLRMWSRIIAGEFQCLRFPGGHFFIKDNKNDVISAIFRELERHRLE